MARKVFEKMSEDYRTENAALEKIVSQKSEALDSLERQVDNLTEMNALPNPLEEENKAVK